MPHVSTSHRERSLAERLAEVLLRKTQVQIAEAAGMQQANISSLLRETTFNVRMGNRDALAKAMGISRSALDRAILVSLSRKWKNQA